MKDTLTVASIITIIGLLIYAVYSWQVYRYHECKKVGHETFYCLMQK